MQLLSTQIVGDSLELTFADDPQTDAATKLLQVRLPWKMDGNKSLSHHRFWFLRELQEELNLLIADEQRIAEGR